MNLLALFFSAEGRIGQNAFWLAVGCLLIAGLLIPALGPLAPLLWLTAFYAWICVQSKRLHDIGRSAWLQALPFLFGWTLMSLGAAFGVLSLLGALLGGGGVLRGLLAGGALLGLGAFLAGGLVHLLLILWLGLAPGQPGFNRYGPPPGGALSRGA
jgi:uncharacterized membrane protein YhaH (DUF805 family)